jgi:cytochrome c oxidase subunit 1
VAVANPWRARTLEWQTTSPPPHENFVRQPVVTGHPYDYGVPGSIHATFKPLPGAAPASDDGDA